MLSPMSGDERKDAGQAPRGAERPGPDEIEAMFARNLPHVRAFVRLRIDSVTRDHEAVSDVVQSACREVLANAAFEFRGEVAFRSYLCQAALHKIQQHRRHHLAKKRAPANARPLETDDSALVQVYRTTLFDPQRNAIRAEEIAQLEAAFARLPADYRDALTMYRIVGVAVPDLARHLGRTEAATKMLLSRAMARLTSLLEEPGAG